MPIKTLVQPERNGHVQEKREALPPSGETYIRAMLVHPTYDEAVSRVTDHAGKEFDAQHAPEMEVLRQECPMKDERAATSLDEVHLLEDQRRATKPFSIVPASKGVGDSQRCFFAEWTLKDQATFWSSLIFMVIVLSAGAANVFGAVQAEAIPIYLEHPFLAVLLACLLPSGSVALHALPEFLENDRQRQHYNKLIAALTFVFLMIWACVFAVNFQLGDDALSAATLTEPSDQTAVFYTAIQLLGELFCGTFLALIASHIYGRYTKDITIPNPVAEELDQLIAKARARYEAALVRQRTRGRLTQLTAMRDLYVNERVAAFVALRRRADELSRMTSYQGGLQ